jgi:hypothetical protein
MERSLMKRLSWFLGWLLGLFLVLTPAACSAANPPLGLQPPLTSGNPPPQLKPKRPMIDPPHLKPKPNRPAASPTGKLQPFFDRESQSEQLRVPSGRSVDATPPLPQLNKFDQAVLTICGEFGSRVAVADVRRMFEQNPAVVKQIQQAVDGAILPGRSGKAAFLDDLVQIWTENHAFSHIFCGEIKDDGKIGGLHYAGRYAQLQQQGVAGRLADNQAREEVAEGAVYTVGVEIKIGNRIVRDQQKGYAYPSDTAEILIDGTWAFKQFQPGRTDGTQSCRYTVEDGAAPIFEMIFVKTDRAIITLYPDATPARSQPRCKI